MTVPDSIRHFVLKQTKFENTQGIVDLRLRSVLTKNLSARKTLALQEAFLERRYMLRVKCVY